VNAVAQPIPFDVPARDPRIELQARLSEAPAEHAEALLAAYQVLQGLHDSGVFDLIRGALGSRDKVLEVAVQAAGSPESTRAIRNLLLLMNMLGSIEPELLKTFTQAGPEALKMMVHQPERPGLWTLIKDFLWNQDFRHGLAAMNTMFEVLGRSLSGGDRTVRDSPSATQVRA
jgi:uncharacterized protein YjgD (DUF1641 family)